MGWKTRVYFIAFIISLFLSSNILRAAEHSEIALSLLRAFSAGCQSYGSWSEAALAHTNSLETVIRELKEKDPCRGISGALANARSLSEAIQQLSGNPIQIKVKEAQEIKRQLLIELNSAAQPEVQQALMAALAQAEVNLAEATASAMAQQGEEGKQTLARGLGQATSYLNTILLDPNLSECAARYPNLGVQIGAGVLSIAGTFVNPAVGAAISALGQLISHLITFFRNYSLDRQIWKLQSIEMAISLSCGLESMESTYCGAEDEYQLAMLDANSYPAQWNPTEFWAGLDLWSKKIPGLISWISKVASGVRPNDPSSADRQNKVWARVQKLQSILRSVHGIIELTRRLLSSGGGGSTDGGPLIRRGLIQILMTMYVGDSPVLEFYPSSVISLYRLLGRPLDCNPSGSGGGGLQPCLDVQIVPLPAGGFEEIVKNSEIFFEEIAKFLLADLHLVIDVDSRGLLIEATQKNQLGQVSPLDVMGLTNEFLKRSYEFFNLIPDPDSKPVLALIEDTQKILADTISIIKSTPGTPEGDQEVISKIFQNLKLVYGTEFFSQRLNRHIKWDLTKRIEHGQIPGNILEILKASGRGAAEELDSINKPSLDRLMDDISNAQAVTQQNLENFIDFFSDGFVEILTRLKTAADRAGEPLEGTKRPNRRVQSRICVLLASGVSVWPKSIDPRLCDSAVVESIYKGFKEKIRFSELKAALDRRQPLQHHMCSYRNFLRRSQLFGSSRPSFTLEKDIQTIQKMGNL